MRKLISATLLALAGFFLYEIFQEEPTPSNTCEHALTTPQTVLSSGWSRDLRQSRAVSEEAAGMTSTTLKSLALKWSFTFSEGPPRSVPALTDQAILLGSEEGAVFALDRKSGCSFWRYQAGTKVRTAFSIATVGDRQLVFFGDLEGYAYAVDAGSGREVWKRRLDDHPAARITGSPVYYQGILYVPLSSFEVAHAVNPLYNCCTFRGGVHAVDAGTGATVWKIHTIAEPAQATGRNAIMVRQYGPSGAAVWSAPTIDERRGVLYVGTGQNYSRPAEGGSDAIIALDLKTGDIIWRRQVRPNDAWNAACMLGPLGLNCPDEEGPDFDFGAPPMLIESLAGKDYVIAGQKSGTVYAFDPENGELIWSTRVGRGGILGGVHWGLAADARAVYVPISDADIFVSEVEGKGKPSLAKLDLITGEILWQTLVNFDCGDIDGCHNGLSAAVTLIDGAVIAPGLDGVIHAYDSDDGREIWSYDTRREYEGVNGQTGNGGTLEGGGAIVADGLMMLNSGYSGPMMGGNVFLVLSEP
jgi:polyvinyl alcohol dehydrogenase (cytochrome)